MAESTEYGNTGFEISGGYVGFIYQGDMVIIDVVTGIYARRSGSGITNGGYFINNFVGVGQYCSVAALSISANFDPRPKDLNYSIYASGVEIT
jgi:hypothetical protein